MCLPISHGTLGTWVAWGHSLITLILVLGTSGYEPCSTTNPFLLAKDRFLDAECDMDDQNKFALPSSAKLAEHSKGDKTSVAQSMVVLPVIPCRYCSNLYFGLFL